MKIVLAHNHFSVLGGAEVFYHEVGRVLEENGHEVAYFSVSEPGLDTEWSPYFPPATDYKNGSVISKLTGFSSLIYSTDAKKSFAKLLDDFQPDLVHVFAIYVGLTPSILDAAKNKHVPVVMSCNDYKHICPNYKLFRNGKICQDCKGGKFYKALTNKCCHKSMSYSFASSLEAYSHDILNIYKKNVSLFLFASEFMAEKTEEFWGADKFKWGILRNPFNTENHVIQGNTEDYFLYFGRLIDEKGVDILLKAAKLVPEIPIKIIGEGPGEKMLRAFAKENDLDNVEFLGPKWGVELNTILRNARSVVVPSLWHENFPYVILQAFAAGKTVIGTNRGGIPEMLHSEKFGWLYDAENPDQLAKVMLNISNLPTEEIIASGLAAQQFVTDNFNDETFYNSLINNYGKILG